MRRLLIICLAMAPIAASATEDPAPAAEVAPPPSEPEAAVAEAAPAAPVERDEPTPAWQPKQRLVYTNFLALRYNPLGLVDRVRVLYRHRLFPHNDGPLFRGAYLDVGGELTLAPTYGSGGARIEVRPLSILALSATYEFIGYFGVLQGVMPLASPQSDYWEDTIAARDDNNENYAAMGSRLTLSATLQGKFGPMVVINTFSALRVDLGLRPGDTIMYDATQDLALPDGGWALLNDLDVGAQIRKTVFGARYSYADALHGTGGPGDLPNHRVGPLVAYTFHERPSGARFNKPTLLAMVQWHAQHPWRSGERRSAAIPLIAIAFQFEGDLWTRP